MYKHEVSDNIRRNKTNSFIVTISQGQFLRTLEQLHPCIL